MNRKVLILLILFTCYVFLTNGYSILLIDDFNDGDNITYQNKLVSSYAGAGASISASINNEVALGNTGYSFEMSYSGCFYNTSGYAGISIPLDTAISYSGYHYISFFIKGNSDAVGDNIIAGYNDGANRFVNICAYLSAGMITTNWQKVVIPIDGLGTNFSSPLSINILAEWKYNSGAGTIYIDNITLGTNIPGRLVLDSFYTTNKANCLYADNVIYKGATYSYNDDYSDLYKHISSYGLKFNYMISNTGWIMYNIGFNNNVGNCSIYSNLIFYAKVDSTTTLLTNIKVEISDNNNSSRYISQDNYKLNTIWQKINMSLNNFSGLTNSHLKFVGFTFDPSAGTTNGSIYFDDIALEVKNYSPDTNAPTTPYNIKVNGSIISNYFVFNPTNGSIISANSSSISNDPSIESVRFEYRLANSGKWIFITEDRSISNSFYQTALWYPPYQKIFDIRVSAVDIYGNIAHSDIYHNCCAGVMLSSSKTITSSDGGWLRDTDFTYVNIPAQSFNESELSFSLTKSYSGKTVKDFADNTGSDNFFYGDGVVINPIGIYFNKNISVSLPASVSLSDLAIYYWDNGGWIEIPASQITDDYGNSLLKGEFDRTGLYIIGLKSTYSQDTTIISGEIENFYMSEKILSPNNDNYNDLVTFSFYTKLDDSNTITCKIVNINGNVVYEKSITPSNHKVNFSWAGKDLWNNYVAPGVYIVYIKASNKSLKTSITVVR